MNEKSSEMKAAAQQELETLLDLIGLEGTVEAFDDQDNEILLHIESTDAGRLIGRGAQMLDAIQYILNRILQRRDAEAPRCVVDAGRYRERRKDRLMGEAFSAAERVKRTGHPYRFAPMRSAERRIIHQALKEQDGIETLSEVPDEYGRKCLVVNWTGGHAVNEDAHGDEGNGSDGSD